MTRAGLALATRMMLARTLSRLRARGRLLGSIVVCFLIGNAAFYTQHAAAISALPYECGSLEPSASDYRTDKDKLPIVERYHFTPNVEFLRRGVSGSLGSELSYTLTKFPNHPRALMSLVHLGEMRGASKPDGAYYSVVCFLKRAEYFRPDDPAVKLVYGIYLLKQQRPKEAVAKLEVAAAAKATDANVQYNLGLAYSELGDNARALQHAHRAYALGFPLPGLKNLLKRRGVWRDPEVTEQKIPVSTPD